MGLFSRAKNLIGGTASPSRRATGPYGVVCPRGHRLRGTRTEGYQAIRCPACDEGVFVLGVSPLPEPPAPPGASRARRGVAASRSAVVVDEGPIVPREAADVSVELAEDRDAPTDAGAEINWEDETRKPAAPRGPRKARPRRVAVAAEVQGAERAAGGRHVAIDEPERLGSRRMSRPLLVFGIVALVVVGTVALRIWRNQRQALPLIAELGRTEGIPALEEGNFDKAHQLLSAARRAVDRLGGAVEGAEQIRRAADDAAIFVNLIPEGLEDMLDQAARANPDSWALRFDDLYQGRSIVLDSRVSSAPGSARNRYEIEYVVMPPGETANFRGLGGARPERTARIDFEGFKLFELAQPKVGDRVLFGARLADFKFDAAADGWIIRLEPDSGVFIHANKALEALGWPPAAETPPEPEGR